MNQAGCLAIALIFSVGCSQGSSSPQVLPGVTWPPRNADPAVKDTYVNAQLSQLFKGSHARVSFVAAFERMLTVNVSPDDRAAQAYSLSFVSKPNESLAHEEIETARNLSAISSSKALTTPGYDESWSGTTDERWVGRKGTIVVMTASRPAGDIDGVTTALAASMQANPLRLPDLIRYAYTMHFGDSKLLNGVLAKLAVVPELSAPSTIRKGSYGSNSIAATFDAPGGGQVRMIAKIYDSPSAATKGLQQDMHLISVASDATQIIDGVTVYDY